MKVERILDNLAICPRHIAMVKRRTVQMSLDGAFWESHVSVVLITGAEVDVWTQEFGQGQWEVNGRAIPPAIEVERDAVAFYDRLVALVEAEPDWIERP